MNKKELIIKNMEQAHKTFKDRGKQYGQSYVQCGEVMQILFPNGIKLDTADDLNRMSLLNMVVNKLIRYSNMWDKPHKDSIHDLGVYAFMLEGIDDSIRS
tara:strand:+ start:1665 stop:1964 length:300 start_codon:yes stop_codon:yes gene_type:complete